MVRTIGYSTPNSNKSLNTLQLLLKYCGLIEFHSVHQNLLLDETQKREELLSAPTAFQLDIFSIYIYMMTHIGNILKLFQPKKGHSIIITNDSQFSSVLVVLGSLINFPDRL